MENLDNFFGIIRLFILLVAGGTVFKICVSIIEGKKVELNFFNPLNLKARWPLKKDNSIEKK